MARLAAVEGAELIITGREPAKLDSAAERIGAKRAVRLDAHDEQALSAFLADTGPVDHLVSMVGDSMSGGFLTTTPETMRHVIRSKFWTNWTIARLATGRRAGSITFTAGTGGRPHEGVGVRRGQPRIAALVQGLAVELGPDVRVNAVAPTFMDTPFWRDLPQEQFDLVRDGFVGKVPLGRLGTVAEVATSYLHLMTNTFLTGQVLAVDGGVSVIT